MQARNFGGRVFPLVTSNSSSFDFFPHFDNTWGVGIEGCQQQATFLGKADPETPPPPSLASMRGKRKSHGYRSPKALTARVRISSAVRNIPTRVSSRQLPNWLQVIRQRRTLRRMTKRRSGPGGLRVSPRPQRRNPNSQRGMRRPLLAGRSSRASQASAMPRTCERSRVARGAGRGGALDRAATKVRPEADPPWRQ
jgi:hypothetical protein